MNRMFTKFATKISDLSGSSIAFLGAIAVIIVWLVTGPIFNYSDTWQLMINTVTSVVTFLMVFLIQNSQSRDTKALHVKLNEIIHVIGPAHNELIDVENLTDKQLEKILQAYSRVSHERHTEEDVENVITEAVEVASDKR
jgi:low affinity Fe/Cu permease